MLKRELKANFKNFIIWLGILVIFFLAVYLVYPNIVSDEKFTGIDEMMQMFPEELLKAFNMDIASMNTAFGWAKTEGWVFVLLIIGVYASILGGNILLKEESDETIEYLGCLPVSRTQIVISKVICGIIYIVAMTLLFGIFNYIALTLSGEFDKDVFAALSITPLFSSLTLFSISLFISTFFRKTKKMIGIALGVTFASYLFNMISEISESVDYLKYISVFTLADIRNVILNGAINYVMVIVCIALTIVFTVGTTFRFNRKEFI